MSAPTNASVQTPFQLVEFGHYPLAPSIAAITADGEIDALNADLLTDYVLRATADCTAFVLDLSRVEFFGTAGFSALQMISDRCARRRAGWAVVPSAAVSRVLRICDAEGTLPSAPTIDSALAAVQAEPSPLLQLVAQPR